MNFSSSIRLCSSSSAFCFSLSFYRALWRLTSRAYRSSVYMGFLSISRLCNKYNECLNVCLRELPRTTSSSWAARTAPLEWRLAGAVARRLTKFSILDDDLVSRLRPLALCGFVSLLRRPDLFFPLRSIDSADLIWEQDLDKWPASNSKCPWPDRLSWMHPVVTF